MSLRRELVVETGSVQLEATLELPDGAGAVVVFAHGSGSSRHSPRNRYVAGQLTEGGLGTLLFDLLTPQEEEAERETRHLRFDVGLLAKRLAEVTTWLRSRPETRGLETGYFGASTGAAAALRAATRIPGAVGAIVSRGGRPDLAADALPHVRVPTLLLVGGNDPTVLELNRQAFEQLDGPKSLEVIPGAGHLFEEPGALQAVARLARDWFVQYLL